MKKWPNNLNINYSSITFIVFLFSSVINLLLAEVSFEFGHFLEPLVNRSFSESDNYLTIINNTHSIVQLRCIATYPVEWIHYDNTDLQHNNPYRFRRIEWTDRKYTISIDDKFYKYEAWIHLAYEVHNNEQEYLCRAVADQNDNITVRFTPTITTDGTKFVYITRYPNFTTELASNESNFSDNDDCHAKFEVISKNNVHFWRCQLEDGSYGTIDFRDCRDAAYCANSYRAIKQKANCAKINQKGDLNADGLEWTPMPDITSIINGSDKLELPGVAVCLKKQENSLGVRAAAIEYFYSGPQLTPRKLSSSNVRPEEMIYVQEPPKKIYYTVETLSTKCILPKYGFSFDPILIITLNGSRILEERNFTEVIYNYFWENHIEIQFSHINRGPGEYIIHCIAPVWNTTEWANHTFTVNVKDVIPPYFDTNVENVYYEDGDMNKSLECNDAYGDPKPVNVSWNSPNIRGIGTSSSKFIFTKVTSLYTDGNQVSCTVTNEFGDKAVKEFNIHVNPPSVISTGIIIAIVFALLLVSGLIFLYVKYLRLGNQFSKYLTNQEVHEFKHGRKVPNTTADYANGCYAGVGSVGTCSTALASSTPTIASNYLTHPLPDYKNRFEDEDEDVLAIECLPYNLKFEVSKKNLFVDFETILGSGEFGIVYKGSINTSDTQNSNAVIVAVKTVKKNVHINYFKALMSELKILAFIGHHENIVNLIGANTANIKNRELFVGVELCKTSLLKFLQENRGNFQNFVFKDDLISQETSFTESGYLMNANTANINYSTPQTFNTYDLIRWSKEIAAGMEFLTMDKRILHGDLAARNVLLSFTLQAKICDFGLSKQLIAADYNYIKMSSIDCPLPWKWMAIESLTEMKFSMYSDCWSYGITLWEIFSLGNVPYPTMTWNLNFVEQLKSGFRMAKPVYANDQIYNKMMDCWKESRKERPKFHELKAFFQSLEDLANQSSDS